jgi:hypothetical protein
VLKNSAVKSTTNVNVSLSVDIFKQKSPVPKRDWATKDNENAKVKP